MSSTTEQLLALNLSLLEAIVAGDWNTYETLCHESLTCFEPEARGQQVEGLPFHEFYFRLGQQPPQNVQTTMASPKVRMLGDNAALITYVRLVQKLDAAGSPVVVASEESRVWQRFDGNWQLVHFHRSPLAG